ncbi:ABC transporter ATP-binding protein [Erwinia piriflorinigrans]|uniref:Iron complex transport system ATP-binding protein n=1 Tax=Erwinia piriflorinigrans CFBP 5888 TaxID=1161919 RepID=V5ZBV7_9GAMM|nr:ABC transporter ATP-binding protein [Erwinia piriflorinigrans]CCG88409.1 iron complex transport system ATP-binding protein [Erwinia piriflorinigrans CFBP 5888]
MSVLCVNSLDICTHSGQLLVNKVSFSLRRGECLAVIGPNGSGKSTLLRALASEFAIRKGSIVLNGQPLDRYSRQDRAKNIALVAQDDPADPRLMVEDYVALGRIPHHHCCSYVHHRRCIDQALADTGLVSLRNRLIGSLSGGEKQRASLARAFAQTPKLLLLDEPTNHLDPLSRSTLLSLVRSKGIATIAVLHDLPLIEPFSDRVVVMEKGRMVTCARPKHALSSKVINAVFGMKSHTVTHPITGHPILIFEASSCV